MKLGRKDRPAHATGGSDQNGSSPELGADGGTALALDEPELKTEPLHRPTAGTEPFGSLLVQRGLVSEDDVARALVVQGEKGKRIGETLVRWAR